MMLRVRRGSQVVLMMAVLLCGLTACLNWSVENTSPQADKVLFERALSAVEDNRFDVANMTLQTLVNTYPDSEYASQAALLLEHPRIAKCGESWNFSPDCHESFVATPR